MESTKRRETDWVVALLKASSRKRTSLGVLADAMAGDSGKPSAFTSKDDLTHFMEEHRDVILGLIGPRATDTVRRASDLPRPVLHRAVLVAEGLVHDAGESLAALASAGRCTSTADGLRLYVEFRFFGPRPDGDGKRKRKR